MLQVLIYIIYMFILKFTYMHISAYMYIDKLPLKPILMPQVFIYIHMFILKCVCMYIYIFIYVYIRIQIWRYIHVHIFPFIHIYVHLMILMIPLRGVLPATCSSHIYTYIYMYTYIYTYIYTCLYISIYTYIGTSKSSASSYLFQPYPYLLGTIVSGLFLF
jgi:hypothetical protein